MSNSALANYINRLTGNYTIRTEMISKITIHVANKVGDCYDLAELLNATTDSAYHYGISTDGTVGLYVDEQYATYSTSNLMNDQQAVNIIVMNSKEAAAKPISDETYDMLVQLCVDICRRNYILKATFKPRDRENSTLTMHSWFANVDCPGAYLSAKYSQLCDDINKQLVAARTATSEIESLKSRSTITVGATYPYMIVPADNALNIDYKSLRDIGVMGVMLHAGAYFMANYTKYSRYINPNLGKQIAEMQSSNLPHALYATVRARNKAEAKQECYELYLVVSKYPPKLGIWLNLDFKNIGRTRAQEVIEVYYDNIVKWGLKERCGFYCTKQQADFIDWLRYTDRFALWVISPIKDVSNVEEVLTPTLFKLEEL